MQDPTETLHTARHAGAVVCTFLLCALLLATCAGCQSIPLHPALEPLARPEVVAGCAAADVVTTIAGTHSHRMLEGNPIWRASVNAGHYLPFVLATAAIVYLITRLDTPWVSATASASLCAQAVVNAKIIGAAR